MTPTLLTVREVADALRVSKMTVYRLCKSDALSHVRVGRAFRFHPEHVDAYLARHTRRAVLRPLRSTG